MGEEISDSSAYMHVCHTRDVCVHVCMDSRRACTHNEGFAPKSHSWDFDDPRPESKCAMFLCYLSSLSTASSCGREDVAFGAFLACSVAQLAAADERCVLPEGGEEGIVLCKLCREL